MKKKWKKKFSAVVFGVAKIDFCTQLRINRWLGEDFGTGLLENDKRYGTGRCESRFVVSKRLLMPVARILHGKVSTGAFKWPLQF